MEFADLFTNLAKVIDCFEEKLPKQKVYMWKWGHFTYKYFHMENSQLINCIYSSCET